ncbi:terminase family protein [Escherichia coli]
MVNELLCAELDHFLDEVKAGNMPRLMVFAPPRSGKSELCSRRFPAYVLGQHPSWNIISCSYSSDLSDRMSRDVKRIITSDKYADVFPDVKIPSGRSLAGGINKTELWEPVDAKGELHGGSYRSAGVNGGITGQGMNIGVIDDPAKDYKTASSPTYQEAVMDWYDTTFFTRVDPKIPGRV